MTDSVSISVAKLSQARCPEDVFGPVDDVQDTFRQLSKLLHPDTGGSAEAFTLLAGWHEKARKKIAAGRYGDPHAMESIVLQTKTAKYVLDRRLPSDDVCSAYSGLDGSGNPVAVKIVRNFKNNDLLLNERDALRVIRSDKRAVESKLLTHIPNLTDSFEVNTGTRRRANVFEVRSGFYSLSDVLARKPSGLDLRDAAWMFNRMLGALTAAHGAGIVHASVTPDSFLIHPERHNGVLVDWTKSVRRNGVVKAISSKWKEFCPSEVIAKKKTVDASTDIHMASKCLEFLLGPVGDTIPLAVRGLIRSCQIAQNRRVSSTHALYQDFAKILAGLYGPPKFRPFTLMSTVETVG